MYVKSFEETCVDGFTVDQPIIVFIRKNRDSRRGDSKGAVGTSLLSAIGLDARERSTATSKRPAVDKLWCLVTLLNQRP